MSDKRNAQAQSLPKGEKLAETGIATPEERCVLNLSIKKTN
jgi:hypothetical protein